MTNYYKKEDLMALVEGIVENMRDELEAEEIAIPQEVDIVMSHEDMVYIGVKGMEIKINISTVIDMMRVEHGYIESFGDVMSKVVAIVEIYIKSMN